MFHSSHIAILFTAAFVRIMLTSDDYLGLDDEYQEELNRKCHELYDPWDCFPLPQQSADINLLHLASYTYDACTLITQTLHFIYLANKHTYGIVSDMLHNLHFFFHKMLCI
jgi:hypothetical protein